MGALNSPQHIYAFGQILDDLIPAHVMFNQNLSIATCVILMITLVFSSEIPAESTDQQLSELEFVEASNTSPRVARLVDTERLLGIKVPHPIGKATNMLSMKHKKALDKEAKAEFGKKVKKAEGHLEDSLKKAVAKAKKKEADAKKSKKALKAKLKAKVKKMAAKVHAAKKKGA